MRGTQTSPQQPSSQRTRSGVPTKWALQAVIAMPPKRGLGPLLPKHEQTPNFSEVYAPFKFQNQIFTPTGHHGKGQGESLIPLQP